MTEYYIAFWNVENLFDVYNSPERSEKLRRVLSKELKGWTKKVLDRKLDQLGLIIRRMNSGHGPDVLGVCEVESESVLQKLVGRLGALGRTYGIAHSSTEDNRGVDVAFIYDKALFTPENVFSHFIVKRTASRDLLQVNFRTAAGNLLVLIGNHWPARTGGQYSSEPYRMLAGETLSYWTGRIQEIYGEDTAIVAMGDFNDEPFNRSMQEYALACNCPLKVVQAESPHYLNLMWRFHGLGMGTHYFSGPSIYDQVLVSRGLISGKGKFSTAQDSAAIERFPEMFGSGAYEKPRPFGRPSEEYDPDGFSDHFPVSVRLIENT